jgi:hypothetical protein
VARYKHRRHDAQRNNRDEGAGAKMNVLLPKCEWKAEGDDDGENEQSQS